MTKNKKYRLARPYEKLGRFLYGYRKEKNLTQRDVSLKLGYSSAQFISNFERGIVSPPLPKLKLLVALYNLPVDKVIDLVVENERQRMKLVLKDR